ncbi:putative Type II secretion system protein K [Burkholderiales bacterium]|jgi:general secretion pathway protein K|nr:putative Type II secretion system protein K [Burkholderiales bacterium]
MGQRAMTGRDRQKGAAVLLALFVVAISTLIVTDLFWRQFVLFRTIDNQQTSSQARLLLHGAQDWARTILQDQSHPAYDALSDPWAQPLAQTRLDQLGETAPLASQATLEGGIEDAQARFNLRNLVDGTGAINPTQLAVLEKLATLLAAPSGTARLIALYVAQAYTSSGPAAAQTPATAVPSAAPPGLIATVPLASGTRPIPPVFPEDLAAVPGIDPGAAQALAPFVVLLDQPNTAVNFNTAGPEMMAATIPELTISDANALAAERDRAYFISTSDIQNRLRGRGGTVSLSGISTNSQYFIVQGTVQLEHASTGMRALVRRTGAGTQGSVTVLWEREL